VVGVTRPGRAVRVRADLVGNLASAPLEAAHVCRYGRGSPVELAVFAGGAARMVGGVVLGVLEEIDADQRGRGGV
jgi:hypothetical protein